MHYCTSQLGKNGSWNLQVISKIISTLLCALLQFNPGNVHSSQKIKKSSLAVFFMFLIISRNQLKFKLGERLISTGPRRPSNRIWKYVGRITSWLETMFSMSIEASISLILNIYCPDVTCGGDFRKQKSLNVVICANSADQSVQLSE